MASVHLPKPDMALYADPASTLVSIPHLIAAPRTRSRNKVAVQFEGDTYETVFRGTGRRRSYEMVARFAGSEHARMGALIDLLELADEAPDGRLQLRSNFWTPGSRLDLYEVVSVGEWSESRVSGRVWDVTFTVSAVNYSLVA